MAETLIVRLAKGEKIVILNVFLWGLIGCLMTILYGVYGNTEEVYVQGTSAIGWMVKYWLLPVVDMSHGWLIPVVSLFMVWGKRNELFATQKYLSLGGFFIVFLALLLYLTGLRVQQTRFVLISLIVLLWGVPFFLYGKHVAGKLAFPCAYLVLCIPMNFLNSLTFPLRMISSTVSVGLLNGFGISVTQMGTAIHVNAGAGFSLDVAYPCSGLRYLLAMVALTTAYAYFTQKSRLKIAILSISAIPLAMIGNITRITLIAIVGVVFGDKFALGFYHDYSGYVVFAVATLLMLGVGALLQRPWPVCQRNVPEGVNHV